MTASLKSPTFLKFLDYPVNFLIRDLPPLTLDSFRFFFLLRFLVHVPSPPLFFFEGLPRLRLCAFKKPPSPSPLTSQGGRGRQSGSFGSPCMEECGNYLEGEKERPPLAFVTAVLFGWRKSCDFRKGGRDQRNSSLGLGTNSRNCPSS